MKTLMLLLPILLLMDCGESTATKTSLFPDETLYSGPSFTPPASELDSLADNGNTRGFRTLNFQWENDSLEFINTNNKSVKIYKNSVNVYVGEIIYFKADYNPDAPLIPLKKPQNDDEYISVRLEQAEATGEMFLTVKNSQDQGIRFHTLVNPDVSKMFYTIESCPVGMKMEKLTQWEYPIRQVILYGFEQADPLRDDCWK